MQRCARVVHHSLQASSMYPCLKYWDSLVAAWAVINTGLTFDSVHFYAKCDVSRGVYVKRSKKHAQQDSCTNSKYTCRMPLYLHAVNKIRATFRSQTGIQLEIYTKM